MKRMIARLALTLLFSLLLSGQTFELADVHTSPRSNDPSFRAAFGRGGRYQIHTANMVDLISTAWGVSGDKVLSGPAWLETDRFDIIAKAPADATPETLHAMLQQLLIERFQLTAHTDTKPVSAYVLTVARKNPNLKEATAGASVSGCQNGQNATRTCHNMTAKQLADSLPGMAPGYVGGTPVIDQTGLTGAFDFNLNWTGRANLAAAGADGASLFDALDRQLGLKLELKNLDRPVVVVDRVNRKPSDNPPGVGKSLPPIPQEFEVADIKPSMPGATNENFQIKPGGRLDAQNILLKELIQFGWELDDDMIVGAPKWMETERFDIVAKATGAVNGAGEADVDAMMSMVRAMVTDRFKLVAHKEDRPVTVYALTAPKPKLKKADEANRTSCKAAAVTVATAASPLGRAFTCQNITMAEFAEKLHENVGNGYIDHIVVDRSGLEGSWDFSFAFSAIRMLMNAAGRGGQTPAASDPNGAISLFEALDKQLGLKLEQSKAPMPVLVIDHLEQKPTEN